MGSPRSAVPLDRSVFRPTPLKKNSIRNCRLYVIVDRAAIGRQDPVRVAEQAVRGGADVIQWRDKTAPAGEFLKVARSIRKVTRRLGVLFVVNDRLAAALRVEADGVHVGHEDFPVREVRALAGRRLLIGRSTHSLREAHQAEADGADYLGVGPVFSTPTKPDYRARGLPLIRRVAPMIRIPWFAIGGIDLGNLALVLSAGAARVAVVRAVAAASDPEAAARAFKGFLH